MAKRKANAAEGVAGNMRVQPEHGEEAERRRMRAATTQPEVEVVEIDDDEVARLETYGSPEELERATVATGHTIEAPVEGKKKVVGYDAIAGKQVYGPVLQAFGPGQEVLLPRSEVKRLREIGFLVDPNRVYKAPSDSIKLIEKDVTVGARVSQSQ